MDYILLILVIILFINKQYNDLWKKDIYNKKNIDNKEKNFNSNYKKTYYGTDLRLKEDIKNSNFKDINIRDIGENEVRKSNTKGLDTFVREIVKSDASFDSSNEKLSKSLNEKIEIKRNLKDNEENNKQDIDIILKDGVNIYNISNNNQQYSLVDICKENKERDEKQESLKENLIENINDKLVDNVEEGIIINDKLVDNLEEEIIINDKEILHKEKNDNKKIIKEYDINKENSESKNNSEFNNLKNKYKGVNVSVVISGIGVLEGEIVFDFPNIIALKNKDNIIIFIDESKVLSIF